jgi:hypothetical protein
VYIPICSSAVLLETVYTSPGQTWSDEGINELVSFKNKTRLAGDMNAKHPLWKSTFLNISGETLSALFYMK